MSCALTGCLDALEQTRIYRLKVSEGHARAIPLAQRVLTAREGRLDPNHLYVGISANNLAWLYYATGDYTAARSLFERAIAIHERTPGPIHLIHCLHGLALILEQTGDYVGARRAYVRSLEVARSRLGQYDLTISIVADDFGSFLLRIGELEEARQQFELSYSLRRARVPPRHLYIGQSLMNLADIRYATGDYEGARSLYEQALDIAEATNGTVVDLRLLHTIVPPSSAYNLTPPNVPRKLHGLANALLAKGDGRGALPLLERALRLREAGLGPNHPSVASSLLALGVARFRAKEFHEARTVLERAWAIRRAGTSPEQRYVTAASLARLEEDEGRLDAALALLREAVRTLETLSAQFEDTARVHYLRTFNRVAVYDALARVLLRLHDRDPARGYADEAWAVLDAKKARIAAEALSASRPSSRDEATRPFEARVQAKFDQAVIAERVLRETLAAPAADDAIRVREQIQVLARTKSEYLAEVQAFLARYPQFKSRFVDQQTVDPRALAKFARRLPATTFAVQYFSAPEALYVFVVTPDGQFHVRRRAVSQDELYALIRAYREYVERGTERVLPWDDDGSHPYRRDVAPLKELTKKLSAHLLEPVTTELNAHGNVVVIPNDLLLFLPFHALTRRGPDGTDRFLAETHALSYVTQLELTDALSREPTALEGALLAVANPDGSLPGASEEVHAVVRLRKRVTTLEGVQATKAAFFELVAHFADVHLATHGVLDPVRPHESYLLFAGQGEREQRLSIGEIAGLSLEPRTLVVLSACETAAGEQVPGAALITLASAFSQAGAQSVVASLWRVNDAATRDFMVSFHERLRVTDRGGALHGAQVSVLRSPRTRHPYYWAPFVLIGSR